MFKPNVIAVMAVRMPDGGQAVKLAEVMVDGSKAIGCNEVGRPRAGGVIEASAEPAVRPKKTSAVAAAVAATFAG